MTQDSVVDLQDLAFHWPNGPEVLRIESLTLGQGETLFLRGASGSGKSTLLAMIAGVLAPRGGAVRVLGTDLASLSAARRDAFRAAHLGVIFQLFNLLPYLSVIENVTLPCDFSAARARSAEARGGQRVEAERLLSHLGVGPELWRRAATDLSVGQQQRVAAARALIGAPALILADEPTSALDADARDAFIGLLKQECAQSGSSLIFVSHDTALAAHFGRALDMGDINAAFARRAA